MEKKRSVIDKKSKSNSLAPAGGGALAPLRYRAFRNIWLGSVFSNLGQFVLAVGATWAMMQIHASTDQVALVQTASMLPIMLLAIPAGALADMFDRRIIAISALCFSFTAAIVMAALSYNGVLSVPLLLLFCFLISCGVAVFGPSWQASVAEQVPAEILPAAIGLSSVSYNIARGLGPAIGGIIVAFAGATAAFALNALLYFPLLIGLLFWKRQVAVARLPSERLIGALVSGFRYVKHSPPIRTVLFRTILTSLAGAPIFALMPLVARDLLGGSVQVYGLVLGAFGFGAIIGGVLMPEARARFRPTRIVCITTLTLSAVAIVSAVSHSVLVTTLALGLGGAAWMLSMGQFNVGVQLSAPRWVAGRVLSTFSASVSGGIAVGSWGAGSFAQTHGIALALACSGLVLFLLSMTGRWLGIPEGAPSHAEVASLADPEVRMPLTGRSGPIIVEIEYRVEFGQAREFYQAMQELELSRRRNGAYNWSLSREIADPSNWTERFCCPTWHDYLRQRGRQTHSEALLVDRVLSFHCGPDSVRVRRMLERPFGSVRWKENTPDPTNIDLLPLSRD